GPRLGLREALGAGDGDVETRLRSGGDQPGGLQMQVRLNDGRHAHARGSAHRPDRGDTVMAAQRAAGDLLLDDSGHFLVKQTFGGAHRQYSRQSGAQLTVLVDTLSI